MTFPPLQQSATPPTSSGAFYEYSGQGILLTVQEDINAPGNIIYVYWFTYDEDGRATWYFGACKGTEEFDILECGGGIFNEQGFTHTKIGTGRVYFTSEGGAFNYETDYHGRGSVILKKQMIAERSGVYSIGENTGQGFNINLFPANPDAGVDQIATAHWFTYINGLPWWCLGTGERNRNYLGEWYELKFSEFRGVFGYPLPPEEIEGIGTALMVVTDGGIGIDYDLDAVGLKATGKYSLVRL